MSLIEDARDGTDDGGAGMQTNETAAVVAAVANLVPSQGGGAKG